MECPKCGHDDVTPSHRRGMEKLLKYIVPRKPYRCKNCWCRFNKTYNPFRTLKAKIIAAAAFLALIIAITLPYIQTKEETAADGIPGAKHGGVAVKEQAKPESTPNTDVAVMHEPASEPKPDKKPVVEDVPEAVPAISVIAKTEAPKEKPKKKSEPAKSPKKTKKESKPKKAASAPKKSKVSPKSGIKRLVDIKQIDSGGDFRVALVADGPGKVIKHFYIEDQIPTKYVIDIGGYWKLPRKKIFPMNSALVSRIRIGKHATFLRVVFDLKDKKAASPKFEKSADGLLVTLGENQ